MGIYWVSVTLFLFSYPLKADDSTYSPPLWITMSVYIAHPLVFIFSKKIIGQEEWTPLTVWSDVYVQMRKNLMHIPSLQYKKIWTSLLYMIVVNIYTFHFLTAGETAKQDWEVYGYMLQCYVRNAFVLDVSSNRTGFDHHQCLNTWFDYTSSPPLINSRVAFVTLIGIAIIY